MQKSIQVRNSKFEWGSRTYVMGILNITPDSFSGDGLLSMDQAVERAMIQAGRFVTSGADILDVGGESTRPGAAAVSAAEEIERVIPVIEALRAEIDVPISIDSYKSVVVDEALKVGADMVNDVWGLRADPKLAPLIAQQKTPVIVMHNRSKPANAEIQENLGGRYVRVEYENLVDDIKAELMDSVAIAQKVGIRDENIILDSGIGFGKTVEQNLELLDRSDEIRDLGYPLLIGTSRKSFIGFTLELPPEKRLEGTAATVAIAIARGADVVRVHDVEVMARVAKMTDAMVRRSN